MKLSVRISAAAALSALAITAAYALSSRDNDALAISSAKIGLANAVQAAEQHVGGKASKAEYERHKGEWVFDVEVVKDGRAMDVKVDATDGKVLSATEDSVDHDDGHDQED
jgi:uncharacterized membrane protein YkoI